MCGLLAFSGVIPARSFYDALQGAKQRGPHGSGTARLVLDDEGDGSFWEVRRSSQPLNLRRPTSPVPLLLAHSRLATRSAEHGGPPDPAENQPLVDGAWAIVHNGNASHASLLAPEGVEPRDSWGMLRLISRSGDPAALVERLALDPAPHALVLARADGARSAWAIRSHGDSIAAHPLYLTVWPDGWVVSSRPATASSTLLPEGATELPLT